MDFLSSVLFTLVGLAIGGIPRFLFHKKRNSRKNLEKTRLSTRNDSCDVFTNGKKTI